VVVAASIRNQRSDDGFALLKRDNAGSNPIGELSNLDGGSDSWFGTGMS
jgi:hypothetical protein